MAIYKTDLDTGEIIYLKPSEIKREVQALTGWSTAQYNREYDKLRNKLRNYEAVIGQKKPGAVNEELYKIVSRQQTTGLTARQEAILGFTSASTKSFRQKAETYLISEKYQDLATQSLISGQFRGLLNKSNSVLIEYNLWLNEIVDFQTIKLRDGSIVTRGITRRERGVTAQEINKFLGKQTADLHRRQRDEYETNKAYYDENNSYPGSD